MSEPLIELDCRARPGVRALFTTRRGGVSQGAWGDASGGGGLNLASHVGDDPAAVATNRALLRQWCGGVDVAYLEQVHGSVVADLDRWDGVTVPRADAAVVTRAGIAACVMVADCLPVLLAAPGGVAAAHAGWKGLAGGVLEASVAALCGKTRCAPSDVHAWLGPAIGPRHFEVGVDVLNAFCGDDPAAAACFTTLVPGKWLADLPGLARLRLHRCGVEVVQGGGDCTVSDPAQFWSYRRDRVCGRQAGLIWRTGASGS